MKSTESLNFASAELGMCIVILGTFIHREPGLAAPILPQILKIAAKYATNYQPYAWAVEK